ncbi:hypothetical protein A2U01_0015307 [Trifolium medium]|uniref:Uncharacterized protein n=1 Tax=Trifolium medium TaxID=97028 RepID=A0A392N5B4_9FABA|nr:hypothetical protein [Trifolium medium]
MVAELVFYTPKAKLDSFTCGLLRQFKPEWRPLLPIDGEEEDEEIEQTVETQESITDVSIVDEKGFAVTIDLSEPEINETNELHELMVDAGDFSHTVDTNSQVDEEEKKLVPDLFSISIPTLMP